MSQDSQALIVWRPQYLFFPPVQEPPPPTRVFRHVDLVEEECEGGMEYESRRLVFRPNTHPTHTPNHEIIFPQLFLNNTFLRFIRNPPGQISLIPVPPSSDNYYTTHPYPNDPLDTNHQPQAFIEEIQEEEEEPESSLESIDETTPLPLPLPTPTEPAKKIRKTTKITLKRKSPEYHEEEDVFSSNYQPHLTDPPLKKTKTGEDASVEQWRVGRRPGFQGSFVAPRKTTNDEDGDPGDGGSSEKKRTFSQSITSAEKVLRKPFRSPTRIPPKTKINSSPTTDLIELSSPFTSLHNNTSSTDTHAPTNNTDPDPYEFPKIDPYFPDFPTPPSTSSSSRSRRSKPSKPFKTPIRTNRSSAPSPSPLSTRGITSSNTLRPMGGGNEDNTRIRELQNEIMIFKQAIKYLREDDNSRLKELILLWRNAGREVVEKLFGIIPRPASSSNDVMPRYQQTSASYWNTESGEEGNLEQMEFIRNAQRNDKGDLVDDEGNVLMIGEDDRDIERFWDGLGGGGRSSGTNWSSRYENVNYDRYENESSSYDRPESTTQEWNYAGLMRMFSVDPDLFGWDAVNEDWKEQEQEGE
uniref:Swi5-dependent recombination DNA repair protein 1 n=1 Tax=Kwoniella bestiolae CBS 10118 TaxID=1296100 RepID=A0A1B9G7L8_9TREE|nr:hypothetical protein I302_04672 [Kwoniella bestiolae CBS 10118]OCF26980.1 hypothetical protein I302_04672 [Kwoniella bestiolae CBS 10118]